MRITYLYLQTALLLAAVVASPTTSLGQPVTQPAGGKVEPAKVTTIVREMTTSKVTLKLTDVPREQVFRELSRLTDTPFHLPGPQDGGMPEAAWPKVVYSVDIQDKPFWVALEEASLATGLTYNFQNGNAYGAGAQGITVTAGRGAERSWDGFAAVTNGPALLMLQSVQRNGVVNPADFKDVDRSISLILQGQIEPKFSPLRGPLVVKVTEAVDEAGEGLTQIDEVAATVAGSSPTAIQQGQSVQGFTSTAVVRLKEAPSRKAKRLAKLKGSATFKVSSKFATMTIENVTQLNNAPMQFRDQLVVVSRPRSTDYQWTVPISIFRNGGTDAEWQALQVNLQNGAAGMRLTDAKGRAWFPAGTNNAGYGGDNNAKIDLQLNFRRDRYGNNNAGGPEAVGPPATLEWSVPIEAADVTVDFNFTDIELP